ncbi:MAG: TolC family protein [Planctomycetota bacterium]
MKITLPFLMSILSVVSLSAQEQGEEGGMAVTADAVPIKELHIMEARTLLERRDFTLLAALAEVDAGQYSFLSQYGIFDPVLGLGTSQTRTRSRVAPGSPLDLLGREHQRDIVDAGTLSLSRLWSAGTLTSIALTDSRTRTNLPGIDPEPYNSMSGSFTITQPLLKGFGSDSVMAAIRQAQESYEKLRDSYRHTKLARREQLEAGYFSWILARQSERVRAASVRRAEDVLRYNRSAYEAGSFSNTEVLEAETQLLERQADLLSSQQDTLDAEDTLRLMLGWEGISSVLTSDEAIPHVEHEGILGEEDLVQMALSQRDDLKALDRDISSNSHARSKAERDVLPQLDLEFEAGTEGVRSNAGRASGDIFSDRDITLTLGLNMTYPLGNNEAEKSLASLRSSRRRLKILKEQLRYQIRSQVREKQRAVEIQRKVVETRAKALESATATLKAETQKHRLGRISTLTLSQVEERSDNAHLNYLRAQRDAYLAVVGLRVTLGSLPETSSEIRP